MKTTLLLALFLSGHAALGQGPLAPPAAPAPTMKTLAQIEARTAIPASPAVPIAGPHFTISAPGSYYLTGNITVISGDGILINASNVTLDLNGFALIKTAGANPTFSSGSAILLGAGVSAIEIKNGRIVGGTVRTFTGPNSWNASFANAGWHSGIVDNGGIPSTGVLVSRITVEKCIYGFLLFGNGACLEHVFASRNSFTGIDVNQGNITNSSAEGNGSNGIDTFRGSITNASARNNGGIGLAADQGSVSNASAISNGDDGIFAAQGSVTNSIAAFNGDNGIFAEQGSVSNATATSNSSDGIRASDGSVTNSRATGNANDGIQVNDGVAAHCVASGNNPDAIATDAQIKVDAGGQRDACVPPFE